MMFIWPMWLHHSFSLSDRSPSRASSTSSSRRAYHHHSTSPERRHRDYNSSTSNSRDRSHTPASAAPSGGVGIGGEVSSSGRSSRSSMRIEDDPIERLRQRLYGWVIPIYLCLYMSMLLSVLCYVYVIWATIKCQVNNTLMSRKCSVNSSFAFSLMANLVNLNSAYH